MICLTTDRLKYIYTHADLEIVTRLFPVTIELAVAIQLDYSKINLHLSREHAEGKIRLLGPVKVDHAAKIQGGEQVAVHHDKGVGQVRNERERAGSSERFVFADILDAQSKLRSVAANSLDELGEIAGADGDIVRPEAASRRSKISTTDLLPSGTSGFGKTAVNGRSRVPFPPARITARTAPFVFTGILDHVAAVFVKFGMLLDVFDGCSEAGFQVDRWFPTHHGRCFYDCR